MGKIRVYEIAKLVDKSNNEVIEFLKKEGITVKSHMSSVDESILDKFRDDENETRNEEEIKEKSQKTNKKLKKNEHDNKDLELVEIPGHITVKELAELLNKNVNEVIKRLFKAGIMATINYTLDYENASKVAESFNFITEEVQEIDLLEKEFEQETQSSEDQEKRPPVVVVMGHVDHGKTSLLDYIRKSSVLTGEAGGITQHIGAYTVSSGGNPITFLDTPGHEAFTAMRLRGAQVTDIAILVVAADDGVMPQTIEAINHARAAGVEIIVAINKIDKQSANPDRVKQELTEHNILVEDWGGDVISVPVSALTGKGVDTLLEMILLTSEMKELKASPRAKARGTVVEAALDKGRGTVATILVQNGTLKVGDPIVVGSAYGKVRAMIDDKGKRIKKAGPSIPVEILGLSSVPQAGDAFYVADSDRHARQLAENVLAKTRVDMTRATQQKVSLDDLFDKIQQGEVKDLNVVVKADVQGSTEAIKNSLEKLSNDEVRVKIIHGGVGAITESDVMLASASNAIIIGFNVRPDSIASSKAKEEKVDLRLYRVIYAAIDDIKQAMTGMLEPVYEEKVIGHAEVRQIFKASGVGTIGGSYVTDGKITRNAKLRLVRDGVVVHDGEIGALKRFKDDAKEVARGYDCGISFVKFNDIKEGDVFEAYVMEEIKR